MNRELKSRIIKEFGTQADFAAAVREHDSKISLIVRGRRELKPEEKAEWARRLSCQPEEIFGSEINSKSNARRN